MILKIKPLSINKAWKGIRFKTDAYKQFERDMMLLLPPLKFDFKPPLRLDVTFGFSSKASDIDNPLKPLLDCLQKKYKFDDKEIYELNVKKVITLKREEFIKIKINQIIC